MHTSEQTFENIKQLLPKIEATTFSWQEYLARFGDKNSRKNTLQMTLNQAGAEYMAAQLKSEEQTLCFTVEDDG